MRPQLSYFFNNHYLYKNLVLEIKWETMWTVLFNVYTVMLFYLLISVTSSASHLLLQIHSWLISPIFCSPSHTWFGSNFSVRPEWRVRPLTVIPPRTLALYHNTIQYLSLFRINSFIRSNAHRVHSICPPLTICPPANSLLFLADQHQSLTLSFYQLHIPMSNDMHFPFSSVFPVAIELIVQHIRDFLNNRGRGLEDAGLYGNGKKSIESNSNTMHTLH